MGTKRFDIKTYQAFDGAVVEYKKKVYADTGNPLTISYGKDDPSERGYNSFSIDIHEVETDSGKVSLRELTKSIAIQLTPDWVNERSFKSLLPSLLNKDENPLETLALAIRLVCPKINFVLDSRRISIADITNKKPIEFRAIYLNDVVGKVEVESELVRVKSANPSNPTIAFSTLTVLARNKSVAFYIDEVEDVGGNALPIEPGETKDKMFLMKNLKKLGADPPMLVYHKQFKDFFNNGDDYETVQVIMILIGLPYCEQLLKWIIYGKPNYENKDHLVIIKFIGEICDKRENEFQDITIETDEGKKRQLYLELSATLFENIQNMGSGWKKALYQIVQNEKK